MNDYLFKQILFEISSFVLDNEPMTSVNKVEEYIEWLVYSETRFKKNYTRYINYLKEVQTELLLSDLEEAKAKAIDIIAYLDLDNIKGE